MSDFDMNRPFGYQVGFDLIKEAKQYLEITTTGDRHTFPFACPATTGVAHFATDLIARMVPEIERLREALRVALEAPFQIQQIMRDNDLALDDLDDKMQKLAFTIYTKMCAVSDTACRALETDDE